MVTRLFFGVVLLIASPLLGAAEPSPVTVGGCPGVLRLQPGRLQLTPPTASDCAGSSLEERVEALERGWSELLRLHPELIRGAVSGAGTPMPAGSR